MAHDAQGRESRSDADAHRRSSDDLLLAERLNTTARRCPYPGCPNPEEHFPVAKLVLPLPLNDVPKLLKGIRKGVRAMGYYPVFIALPEHPGMDTIFASRTDPKVPRGE